MKKIFFILIICLIKFTVYAATVDTVSIFSKAMNKDIEVVIITPEKKQLSYPTIYLLHGYGGDAKTWIGIKPDLPSIAEEKGFIFVCPDGKNSWYWDSSKNPSYKYETFVANELVEYIDSRYPTKKHKKNRAISGLSMGGHGALWIAFRHHDIFGAAGSMSGGVDIRPFPGNWEMSKQLGEYGKNKTIWDNHTVINQINNIKKDDLALIIDCGTDDFFIEVNNNFHAKLLEHQIDHDYIVRPGGHTRTYWKNSLDYHILFFSKFFDR